jgi:hypothetical protein
MYGCTVQYQGDWETEKSERKMVEQIVRNTVMDPDLHISGQISSGSGLYLTPVT